MYLLERASKLLCYRNIPPNQPHPHPTFPTHVPCSTNFRSQIITIDSSDITSNGLKPLNTREDMGYCESKLFTWTEIEKVGYTTFPKAGPSFMVLILKNDEIQTVILQQFFSWKSIQKEIDAFMPCANFGDHRAFLTSHLQQN